MKKLLCLVSLWMLISGCSVQKMAGESVIEYTHDTAIPYLMAQDDLVSACSMGQSMGPVVASFERLELDPKNVAIATHMAAGMCAELDQRGAELDRERALFENHTNRAQDAMIREKLSHRLAALRMIQSYEAAMHTFGNFSQSCRTFENKTDELLALLGLASGALAILHDFNSEKSVGISLDVPGMIEKSAACFSDDAWWGMPTALRASIWLSIPGAGPEDVDPLKAMQEAATSGDAQGVLLARAMLVMMANTVGRDDVMCRALAEIPDHSKLNRDYALLNAYAISLMTHYADVKWTKLKGYRAPFMQPTCPSLVSPAQALSSSDVDDLLDGLLDDETSLDTSTPETPLETTTQTPTDAH